MDVVRDILPYLLGIALVVTVAVLLTGIIAMARGGRFNARYGNILMRMRVVAQGAAVILLALMFALTYL